MIKENRVGDMAPFMHADRVLFSGAGSFTSRETFSDLVRSGELTKSRMDFETLRVKIYGDTGVMQQRGHERQNLAGQCVLQL